jgi:3-oxoadipate enol-lactonase
MQVLERPWGRMHVADQGPADGPVVVFANSLGTDLRLWDPILPLLPAGLRVLRFDKRGHGLSDPCDPVSIDGFAEDCAALIEARANRPVLLVGLSIGGLIAQALAARRPELLTGLVLSNTAARIGTPAMWEARLEPVRAGGVEAIGDIVMERWFTEPTRRSPAMAPWRNMLVRTPTQGYIAASLAIAACDLTATTARLTLPTLVIAGSHDGSTPPPVVAALAKLIAGSRYALIEDTGHLPCVEAPERFAALLVGFMREIGHV